MVSMFFESATRAEYITLSFGTVTAGYFEALGTPLETGRRFDAADDLAEVSPVMVSETAARFVYPNQDAASSAPWPGALRNGARSWPYAPRSVRRPQGSSGL